jgi:hypothetical protein
MELRGFFTVWFLIAISTLSHADTIPSLQAQASKIDACQISHVATLGRNAQKDITIRAVEMKRGQSTDVRPRYRLLITYFHGGEMNNTRTAFDLGYFWEITAYKRLKAGLFQIYGTRLVDEATIKKVIIVLDATQVFIDDRNISAPDFSNPYFASTIQVKESTP